MNIFRIAPYLAVLLITTCGQSFSQNIKHPSPEIELEQKGLNEIHPQIQEQFRDQASWQEFQNKYPEWQAWFNESTGLPHRAFGPAIEVNGEGMEEKARNFLQDQLGGFDIIDNSLEPLDIRQNQDYYFVDFTQYYKEKEVLTSRITLRFTKDKKVCFFGIDYFPDIELPANGKISEQKAKNSAAKGIFTNIDSIWLKKELKVLPVNGDHRLIYEVIVTTGNTTSGIPGHYYTIVDAHSGKIWYRRNRVISSKPEIEVKSEVVMDYPAKGTQVKKLVHLKVEDALGTTYYTNDSGQVTIDHSGSINADISLEGKFARVRDALTGTIPSFTVTLDTGKNTLSFTNEATLEERSAYYHTTLAHDYMKQWFPSFTALDQPIRVNTDVTTGACNAFYYPSQNSVNYFEESSTCHSFALVDDVVYHEYGHAICHQFYRSQGSYFRNGALGEAFADIWAMGITNEPILGKGSRKQDAGLLIRRYDTNPKVYPEDLTGEVHADGEILAGAFWDLKENLDSLEHMMDLYTDVYYALPDGMDGEEGAIYRDVLLEVLMADDNDNNLSNGTPNQQAITTAFSKHGITLISGLSFDHQEKIVRKPGDPFTISAEIQGSTFNQLGEVRIFYKLLGEGNWHQKKLDEQNIGTYSTQLSGFDTGAVMTYYFQVFDQYGNSGGIFPLNAGNSPGDNLPYFTLFAFEKKEKEAFKSQNPQWQVEANAQTGNWQIGVPIGSYLNGPHTEQNQVQPSEDHSKELGNYCAFTANAIDEFADIGEADVDEGTTSLTSSWYDISDYEKPLVSYYRWFTNNTGANPGNDPWEVYIQGQDEQIWRTLEFTRESHRKWRLNVEEVYQYVDSSESHVRLKFKVSDDIEPGQVQDGQSLVEAAIDDIQFYSMKNNQQQSSSVVEKEKEDVLVFPNPTTEVIKIDWTGNNNETKKLTLLDIHGKVLMQKEVESRNTRINLREEGLPKGVYQLRLRQGDSLINRKVIYQ